MCSADANLPNELPAQKALIRRLIPSHHLHLQLHLAGMQVNHSRHHRAHDCELGTKRCDNKIQRNV